MKKIRVFVFIFYFFYLISAHSVKKKSVIFHRAIQAQNITSAPIILPTHTNESSWLINGELFFREVFSGPKKHFRIGFLAPWNAVYEDFSALSSASAIALAIEAVHSDPTLGPYLKFRFVLCFMIRMSFKNSLNFQCDQKN